MHKLSLFIFGELPGKPVTKKRQTADNSTMFCTNNSTSLNIHSCFTKQNIIEIICVNHCGYNPFDRKPWCEQHNAELLLLLPLITSQIHGEGNEHPLKGGDLCKFRCHLHKMLLCPGARVSCAFNLSSWRPGLSTFSLCRITFTRPHNPNLRSILIFTLLSLMRLLKQGFHGGTLQGRLCFQDGGERLWKEEFAAVRRR